MVKETGNLAVVGSTFTNPGEALTLNSEVSSAVVTGNKFAGRPGYVNQSSSARVIINDTPVAESKMPVIPRLKDRVTKPAKTDLYVVTESPWNPRTDTGADDTPAIQRALDAAGENGGGIVFLPGGMYPVHGNLSVPAEVELRGTYDMPHTTIAAIGTGLMLYGGRGDEKAPPALTLKARAGLRGVSLLYPEQTAEATPYPFTIQGQGADIYLVSVTGGDTYKFVDLMNYRCDNHYLESLRGDAFREGVAVGGGSTGGELRDIHLKPGRLNRNYPQEHLEAFVLGDCNHEFVFQNMVYGTLTGYRFIEQNGRGASAFLAYGAGADASPQNVVCEALGKGGADFINAGIENNTRGRVRKTMITVRPGCNGQLRFYNPFLGGKPDNAARIESGSVLVEMGNFSRFAPFEVNGGTLSLMTSYLGEDLTQGAGVIHAVRPPSPITVSGTFSPAGITRSPDTAEASVVENCNTKYEPSPIAKTYKVNPPPKAPKSKQQ